MDSILQPHRLFHRPLSLSYRCRQALVPNYLLRVVPRPILLGGRYSLHCMQIFHPFVALLADSRKF